MTDHTLMKRITITIDNRDYDKLVLCNKKTGKSISSIIRKSLWEDNRIDEVSIYINGLGDIELGDKLINDMRTIVVELGPYMGMGFEEMIRDAISKWAKAYMGAVRKKRDCGNDRKVNK